MRLGGLSNQNTGATESSPLISENIQIQNSSATNRTEQAKKIVKLAVPIILALLALSTVVAGCLASPAVAPFILTAIAFAGVAAVGASALYLRQNLKTKGEVNSQSESSTLIHSKGNGRPRSGSQKSEKPEKKSDYGAPDSSSLGAKPKNKRNDNEERLQKRRQKLSSLEDKSGDLANSASGFAETASRLAERIAKEENKKPWWRL